MSVVLDDKYWENWEKSLVAEDKLWLKVCTAKNQKDRNRAYRKWHSYKFGKPFIFR